MMNTALRSSLLMVIMLTAPACYAVKSNIIFSNICEPLTTLNINGEVIHHLLIDTGATGGIHLKENILNSLPGNPAQYIKNNRYVDAFGLPIITSLINRHEKAPKRGFIGKTGSPRE
ncbi:hypothetical protein [Sodalis sp. RH19]|uniref:hypothetical protein n=2 Tax=Sodalis TaxID=84565 RepID=UPI0039B6A4C0